MSLKNSWIMCIARVGYVSKAIIYGLLGTLIIYAAVTARGVSEISKKSVFEEILFSPFGTISLSAVIIGMICYVMWRVVQGVTNPSNLDMTKPSKVMLRMFYFFSATAYSLAAYAAIKVLLGSSDDGSKTKEQVGDSIMQETWGVVLVGAIAIAIVIFAFIQFKHAYKQDFMDKFVSSISATEHKLIQIVGRGGYVARGVVYSIIAGFFAHAAYTSDGDKAGGLGEALLKLLQQPFGPWLVGLVGLGMLSFAIFCGFEGRYRKTS